uniref:Uncharacterized protein n=1 Tax=Anguilla anguilla TaxID=7936 RepID=A0A0E9VY70_ANGAN
MKEAGRTVKRHGIRNRTGKRGAGLQEKPKRKHKGKTTETTRKCYGALRGVATCVCARLSAAPPHTKPRAQNSFIHYSRHV